MVNSKKKPVIKEIVFSSDNFLLKGHLHLPPVDRPPVVIGSHGLFSDQNSPKQIQEIFFEKLDLPVIKKTPKGQPSTAEAVQGP